MIAVSCGVGHTCGLDLEWLWRKLADAALIGPLAWEPPYAAVWPKKGLSGRALSCLHGLQSLPQELGQA